VPEGAADSKWESPPGPQTPPEKKRLVLVTGMSGAGKSFALKTLEDLGYFAIDNLPSSLYDPLMMLLERNPEVQRVALGMDGRDPYFVTRCEEMVRLLAARGHSVFLLFLDASDEVLIRRFSETRRPHPLARNLPVEQGVRQERQMLSVVRRLAARVLDTSTFNVHQLRNAVADAVGNDPSGALNLIVASFGYKYGLPLEAAFVFDVRFLPNPFFVQDLSARAGTDPAVAKYVFSHPAAGSMVNRIVEMVVDVLPLCRTEGRSSLMVAVGCTGGQHRSVAIAAEVARKLREKGVDSTVTHRDVQRAMGGR